MRLFKRHKHRWEVFRCLTGEYVIFGGTGTQIYCRCADCGQTKVESRDGIWKVEDFD